MTTRWVVAPMTENFEVQRVLIDNEVSVDIFFYDAFLNMGLTNSQLTSSDIPIYGFSGVESKMEGTMYISKTIGEEPREAIQMLNFLVIKATSTYNAILGQTWFHTFKVIASTYHLKIKFSTRSEVGEPTETIEWLEFAV